MVLPGMRLRRPMEGFKDDGLCVLNRGESSLTILLTNGAVTSVQYALIIK